MVRLTLGVALIAACGRVDFDDHVDLCDVEHRIAAPFATAGEPYRICTEDQLDQIGQHPELWSAAFELAADLDVSARPPVPYIGTMASPFAGAFDGGGHTIAGLHYDDTVTTDAVGLFAAITTSAYLANLVLVDVDIRGDARNVGGLVGYAYGSLIENITLERGTVIGGGSTGGLIGGIECYDYPDELQCFDGAIVRHVTVNATVMGLTTFYGVGGAFGYAGTQPQLIAFDDIHTTGSVSGMAEVGGIGGDVEGIILDHSDSSATVMATERGGGLTGDLTYGNTVIRRSHASGDVTCVSDLCGGAISETDGAGVTGVSASGTVTCGGSGCGGFAGDIEGVVRECYATGDVTGGQQVGGLVGYARGIADSYATGNVTGMTSVGGLVGFAGPSNVVRSYATGIVTASGDYAGGLIGQFGGAGSYVDSFSTGSVTGTSATGYVGALLGGTSSGMYTSTGNATSGPCANTAGACTADAAATTIADKSYFTTVTNAPMVRWDFTSIWQPVAGALPTLRKTP